MNKYWLLKQDLLLQKHHNARPNEKEFWFSNIVNRLNEYQKHIKKENKK